MELKKLFAKDERAVSPVIGVILMVAITVILAAVIGTFVLGLGQNVNQTPQAGFSFDQSGSGVTVTYVSAGNIDSSTIDAAGCSTSDLSSISAVGDSASVSCTSGQTLRITAKTSSGGTRGVVASYTVD